MNSEELLDAWLVHQKAFRKRATLYFQQDSEDALQETFVRVYRRRQHIGDQDHLRCYALAALRNHHRDFCRYLGKVAKYSTPRKPIGGGGHIGPNAERYVLLYEIDEAAQHLEERDQEVLLMIYRDDVTLAEASRDLEIPMTTLASRRQVAIRRLRRKLSL